MKTSTFHNLGCSMLDAPLRHALCNLQKYYHPRQLGILDTNLIRAHFRVSTHHSHLSSYASRSHGNCLSN